MVKISSTFFTKQKNELDKTLTKTKLIEKFGKDIQKNVILPKNNARVKFRFKEDGKNDLDDSVNFS